MYSKFYRPAWLFCQIIVLFGLTAMHVNFELQASLSELETSGSPDRIVHLILGAALIVAVIFVAVAMRSRNKNR